MVYQKQNCPDSFCKEANQFRDESELILKAAK